MIAVIAGWQKPRQDDRTQRNAIPTIFSREFHWPRITHQAIGCHVSTGKAPEESRGGMTEAAQVAAAVGHERRPAAKSTAVPR